MKLIEVSPVEIRVNVKGITETKAAVTRWLLQRERPRCALSGVISIIVHLFFISSWFMLGALHEPMVQEIREVSFIDLTEEPVIKQPKSGETTGQRSTELASYSNPEPNVAGETLPPNVTPKRFDMIREQAPLPLAGIVHANVSEALSISPAKGTSDDDKIANLAAPIELNRNNDLATAGAKRKLAVSVVGAASQSQIKLERKASGTGPGASSIGNRVGNAKQFDQPNSGVMQTTQVAAKQTSTIISGPLANRKILEKTIPPFPLWAKRQGVGANVSLQFTVMEDGLVKENVVVVMTSGSREWDDAVIAALKKWRFAPLPTNERRQNQSGVITFQFVID